jgi:tetratricopeptide (TPR) repeat protein
MGMACVAVVFGPLRGTLQAQESREQSVDEWTAQHFRLARQAQLQNDFNAAVEEYRAIISRNPKFAGAYLNLGLVYHEQRKYREAVKALESAASLQPGLLGAQLFLGIDLYMVEDLKGSVQHLGKALEIRSDDRQAGMYLGLAYLDLDQPEKAAQQLRKTARHFPDDPEIFYHEGEAYLAGMGQSLKVLRQAGSDSAIIHWARAMAAEQKSDRVGAIEEYLQALARDPGIAELYLRLATAFNRGGLHELVAACLERYERLNPERDPTSLNLGGVAPEPAADKPVMAENKEAFLRLWQAVPAVAAADALPAVADETLNRALKEKLLSKSSSDLKAAVKSYLQGNYTAAAKVLRLRVDRHADNWLSAYLLARCYLSIADYNAAQDVLETHLIPFLKLPSVALLRVTVESQLALQCFDWVVAHQPNSYLAKLLSAKFNAACSHDQEAIATYQEVLKLAPNRLGVHMAIGQIYEDQLHWAPAIEEYEAELALDPDSAMALVHLGHAYAEAQDPDRAIPTLNRLLQIYPTDGGAYADLGKAWALKGDSRKAIASYEQALRYDSDQNGLHYRLFQLYRKTGDMGRAQSHLAAFKLGEIRQQQATRESMAEHERDSNKATN